jgi:hypothetical protein
MSIRPQQHGSLQYEPANPLSLPETGHGARSATSARIARARLQQVGRAIRESGLVVFAVLSYFMVRGLMSTSVDRAHEHAIALLKFERWLGIAWEADMQGWVSGHGWLAGLANSVYIYGHWPVIALTLGWLLWKHGDEFRVVRNAMVISGLIGFVFFALYPMAPPRFLTELGFVDTVTRDTSAYRVLQPPAFTNQYAAMPSLHVGWNLLMGIAIFSTTRHAFWRTFAILMPLAMYISTILTANHFVLDGIVGSIVALTGLMIARYFSSRNGHAAAVSLDPCPAVGG